MSATPATRPADLDRHPIEVLRAQIAPDASDGELAYFAEVCARLNLSPFADQIVLIGRWDSRVKRKIHRHQITVAGRRTLAARTGDLRGIEGPVWSGPRDARGQLNWQEVWDDETNPPYCARVLVHVKDWVVPANGTAKWSEFVQLNNDGTIAKMWRSMPSHMLGKVAESMALRRAFPDTITPAIVDGFDRTGDAGADDLAELAEAAAVNAIDQPDEPAGTWDGAVYPDHPAGQVDIVDDQATYTIKPGDQTAAHRAIAELDQDLQATFLDAHGIKDFGEIWPADAVYDALTHPFTAD